MIHPGPATASPIRLFSAGVPLLLVAQLAPGGSGDLLAWAMAAAAAVGLTVGTVALVQHRRSPWRSRHRAHDVLVLFAPPDPAPTAPAAAPARPAPRPASVGPVGARRAPARPVDDFPADGTLQVLPGRLEVLAGITLDNPWEQEIRFVRVPGSDPELTLGRGEGPPHRHLRLGSATVSRQQAHMRYGDEGWTLTNLSRTNPTVVNSEALAPGASTLLREGDRVEMGEVAFRFRER